MERRQRLVSRNRIRAEIRRERDGENVYDTWRPRFDSVTDLTAQEAIAILNSERRRLVQRKTLIKARASVPSGFLWSESRKEIDSVLDAELRRIDMEIARLNESLGDLGRKEED